jgi:hypothetical protein
MRVCATSMPSLSPWRCGGAALSLLLVPALASAQAPRLNRYGNPETLAPAPTSSAITEQDLRIRLYQFADDSMMGRQVGRLGNK